MDPLTDETRDWVTLKALARDKSGIREKARQAVEKAADAGDTPLSISRKTGVSKGRVALWMMLNRHPESPS
jgi:hypothetical protein